MRSELPAIASDVGVAERTLRRAVRLGTVRCSRPGPRRLVLDADERTYLRTNWELLAVLAQALRTERNVRMAVVFGSLARGTAKDGSDVDVLVALAQERPMYLAQLTARLSSAVGREVEVVSLASVRERDPALLSSILREGRPIVDRDGLWPALLGESDRLRRAATRARAARHRRAVRAVAHLAGMA